MKDIIRFYWSIYRQFVATCFAQASSFRLHFVLLIVMDLFFYASLLLTVGVLYDHLPLIHGWNRNHFIFFVSFVIAVDQLHMTFLSENFWWFSEHVRTGTLDFILLKPGNPLFTVFLRVMRPGSLCLLPVPWALLIHFGRRLDLTAVSWMLLPLGVLLATAFRVSFEILISMGTFWMVQSYGINFVRIQFQNISRWPDFAYLGFFRRVFTFVFPILLMGSAPVRFLFDPWDWSGVLLMLVYICALSLLAAVLWRIGLRQYESASS
jgi:ABC-2 type transport system permease protein